MLAGERPRVARAGGPLLETGVHAVMTREAPGKKYHRLAHESIYDQITPFLAISSPSVRPYAQSARRSSIKRWRRVYRTDIVTDELGFTR